MKINTYKGLALQKYLKSQDRFHSSCYENALEILMSFPLTGDLSIEYVEGFVDSPNGLVMHGWLVFGGEIYDPHFAHLLFTVDEEDYKPVESYTKDRVEFLINETYGERFSLPFARLEDMR